MSLHTIVQNIQKAVKILVIASVVLVTLYFTFQIIGIIGKILNPPKAVLPEQKFGNLSAIKFSKSTIDGNFKFNINTLSGKLPEFKDRANVYKISQPKLLLINTKTVREKAAGINFVDKGSNQFNETMTPPTSYRWDIIENNLIKTLYMDSRTYNFRYITSYKTYPPILEAGLVNNDESVKSAVSGFLVNLALIQSDIDDTKTTIRGLMMKNGMLLPADNTANIQIFRVNLFQKDVNNLPIFYNNYPFSSMSFFILARAHDANDVVEAEFFHQQIDANEKPSDYPLKTIDEAYAELEQGNSYITNYNGSSESIAITDVKLGYYMTDKDQEYLMPVYLFLGENDFSALVQAIPNTSLK